MTATLCYLATARLHRVRANLIQTVHTAAAFARAGVRCTLYLPPWRAPRNVSLPLDPGRARIVPLQLLHSRWPRLAPCLAHRRRWLACDAVYVRSAALSRGLRQAGITHHLEIHTLRELKAHGQVASIVEAHRRGRIAWLIPISHGLAAELIELGADPARIRVAPSAVDPGMFAAVAPFSGAGPTPRGLYVGTISADRGLEVLEHLAREGTVQMDLVGRLDAVAPPVYSRYRPAVPHREVPALYSETDFALMPYQTVLDHADGISPMKLFEAMAAGRPIIASDLPPLREVLSHGENALLVPPDDLQAWTASVERLSREPGLAMRLAERARQDVLDHTWDTRARSILEAIGLGSPDFDSAK